MDVSLGFVGAGFSFLQTKLLLKPNQSEIENDLDETDIAHHQQQQPKLNSLELSESAKEILVNLLKQEHVQLSATTTKHSLRNISSSSRYEQSSATYPLVVSTTTNKTVIHPEMSNEMKLNLAYNNQGISLLGSILYIIDQYTNPNQQLNWNSSSKNNTTATDVVVASGPTTNSAAVSTKHIIQHCAYTVIPQKTPAVLSSREMVCTALHFLCQEYPVSVPASSLSSNPTTSIPSTSLGDGSSNTGVPSCTRNSIPLPLIYSTSVSTDIERRSYEKAYDWNFTTILPQILLLEDQFYNEILLLDDNNDTNPLLWLPREMFVPNIQDEQLLRQLYIQGSLPLVSNDDKKDRSKKNSSNDSIKKVLSSRITDFNTHAATSTTKTLQIKRKRPPSKPKNKSDHVDIAEEETKQRTAGTATVKKIKITTSSSKQKKDSAAATTIASTTAPPIRLDNILATEISRIMPETATNLYDDDDDATESVDDNMKFE